MRLRAKVDTSQAEVVEAFKACGYRVRSIARLGDDAPDLLVYRALGGQLRLVEVKTGKEKQTPGQLEFAMQFPVSVARTAEDVIALHRQWMGARS